MVITSFKQQLRHETAQKDEGGPFGAGLQEPASNHLELQ
jgi:hypothetical protein